MSKIFDALKKSEARPEAVPPPAPPPEEPAWSPPPAPTTRLTQPAARSEARGPEMAPARIEPVQPRWTELVLAPSGLELPLEFVRELGTLRGTIDQLLPGRSVKTLLFAGAIPGEGSSTVAAAFARLLAEDE